MSVSEIEEQIREMYNFEVSISNNVKNRGAVAREAVCWQNRPLEDLYLIVWMDEIMMFSR